MVHEAGFFDHGPNLPPEHWESFEHGHDLSTFPQGDATNLHGPSSPASTRSNALSIHLPSSPTPLEAASASLQYLPLPVIILGPLKTVILANEAMAKFMGYEEHNMSLSAIKDGLMGQTLSQVGVDMVQNGFPIWVDWESFLDSVGTGSTGGGHMSPDADDGGDLTPKALEPPSQELSVENLNKTTVHDMAVEVVISPPRNGPAMSRRFGEKKVINSNFQAAQMIISAWELESMKYFTLCFTSQSESPRSQAKVSSRSVFSASRPSIASPHSSSSSVSERRSHRSSGSSKSASGTPSPSGYIPSFPPQGPPLRANLSSAPSILQKATRLREALLNSINIPCYALWRDESVGIPNDALMRLAATPEDGDEGGNTREFLNYFKAYTEDFSRALTVDEFPIIQLVRSQKPFSHRRVGIRDPKNNHPRIFDLSGELVTDHNTGEFLGGVVILKDITEYLDSIAAQKELNSQQFSVIANMIPQMVWTARPGDGMHEWFSQRWYDYTGLTVEESVGIGWKLPFHPEDLPTSFAKWNHSLRTGDEYTTEYRCRRRDGEWRWMLGRARPLRDDNGVIINWFGTYTDIHEAVEAREAARATRERLLQVLETAKVTLWTADRNSRVTMVDGNTDWITTRGRVQIKDMIGCEIHRIADLFRSRISGANPNIDSSEHDLNMIQQKEMINNILNGKSPEEAVEACIPGPEKWFRTRYLPLYRRTRHDGVEGEAFIDGVVGASVDITELRGRERDLQQQEKENSKLLANALAAKEASRMKSQFLANMSHEIRTPIAGVIGMSELILDTALDEEQRECAENIQRSANGLLTVINDILDFSKVESGRLEIEEVQFNLSVVLKDVDKMLSFAAERKGLAYESDTEPEIAKDLRVLGDPGRLRQILQNLLSNSIKFTSEGRVTTRANIVRRTAESLSVEFVVQDTGIGIAESVRSKLFQPFSQADSSTARRFGGSGLGLTICKNLVELMHGEISLNSIPGQGTRASFWIPFKKAEYLPDATPLVELGSIPDRLQSDISVSCGSSETRGVAPISPPAHANRERSQQPEWSDTGTNQVQAKDPSTLSESERQAVHVLVVEDNPINQQIALKTIKKLHFSVNAVWNGREALDYLMHEPSQSHPTPDIILMDCQMPVLDGYGATRAIRYREPFANLPRLKGIPIVAMTASAIQGDKEKCQKAGMDDYLAKPVRPKLLEKMLVKWSIEGQSRRKTIPHESATEQVHSNKLADSLQGRNRVRPGLSTLATGGSAQNDPRHYSTDSLDTRLDSMQFDYYSPKVDNYDGEVRESIWQAEHGDKTMSLRDDKILLETTDSSGNSPQQQHHFEDSERHPGAKGPSHALTQENIDRFIVEQDKLGSFPGPSESNEFIIATNSIPTGIKLISKPNVEPRYSSASSKAVTRPALNSTGRQDSDTTVRPRR